MLGGRAAGRASAERPTTRTRSRGLWSALTCPTSGEVLLSAAPGFEFIDWGRQAHVGGGSHGSLHASDSLGALLFSGLGAARAASRRSGRSRDVAPLCWSTSACPIPAALASGRSETPAGGSARGRARAGPSRRRAAGSLTVKPVPESPVAGRAVEHAAAGRTHAVRAAGAGDRERAGEGARSPPRTAGLLRGRLHRRAPCAGR